MMDDPSATVMISALVVVFLWCGALGLCFWRKSLACILLVSAAPFALLAYAYLMGE